MASTRLVRKALRNRAVSKKRVSAIKRLTSKPVIRNVDIEQIKEEFANKKTKPVAKKEAPAAEPKAEKKEVAPKAEVAAPEVKEEKKSVAKKAPAKKAAPKAKKESAQKAEKKEDKAE